LQRQMSYMMGVPGFVVATGGQLQHGLHAIALHLGREIARRI